MNYCLEWRESPHKLLLELIRAFSLADVLMSLIEH